MWSIGLGAYLVAIFHRFSLGVAGIAASERLGISAAVLALFPVVQLAVYAAMQIPVGALLDRFGPKRMLLAGLTVMAVGQVGFSLATDVVVGLVARILVGAGDAMIFISVLRLAAAWFPSRRVSLVTQLIGVFGQLGAVVSAVPLTAALHELGWTVTYLGAGLLGGLAVLPVLFVVRDTPQPRGFRPIATPIRDLGRNLVQAWREPGTRLGMWTHFTTQFSGTVFAVLWGYPFLVAGQGLSPAVASGLLTTYVLAGIAAGPVLGYLAGRYVFHRSRIALSVVALAAGAWTVVLLWPGPAPLPVLIGFVVALAPSGPASMIGFDHARTFNPADRLGSASGIVNVGGFTASLLTILAVGVLLDLQGATSGAASLDSYRIAFAVQYLVWLVGTMQILRYRRRARAALAARDPEGYAALRRGDALPATA